MMTVSRVSRKTTKKTGTEKTWTVMVGGCSALGREKQGRGVEGVQRRRELRGDRDSSIPSKIFTMDRVKRRAWAGEDQIMQKDLITAIKRDGGVLALACPCSAHPRVTDDPSDCGRKAEGHGTTAGRCSEGYANTAGGENRIAEWGHESCACHLGFSLTSSLPLPLSVEVRDSAQHQCAGTVLPNAAAQPMGESHRQIFLYLIVS